MIRQLELSIFFLLVFQGSKCTNSGFVLCKYAQYIPWEAIYMIILIQLGLFQYSMCYGNKREYVLSVVSHERYVYQSYELTTAPPPPRGTPPATHLSPHTLSQSFDLPPSLQNTTFYLHILYKTYKNGIYIGATRMIQFHLVALYPHQLLNITVSFV